VFTPGAPGLTAGDGMTTLQFPGTLIPGASDYVPTSWYGYTLGPPAPTAPAPQRMTDHQANIRGVRIVIVARGPDPDPAAQTTQQLLPILNQNALPAWVPATTPYNRSRVETTVLVRNMASRGMNDF
jgi:type IV pilus assembly protein PilW